MPHGNGKIPAVSRRWQIAKLIDGVGLTKGILRLRAQAPSPWLTIFTYHRIRDTRVPQPFDDGVVDATPEGFDEQVATMKRHFNIVGIDDLLAYAQGGTLPPNPLAITFDDGYLDNYQLALPVLKKHDVRAVFFIATTYLTERRIFWWDRICYTLKTSTREAIELRYPVPMRVELTGNRRKSLREVLRIPKDHFDLDLDRFLDELTAAAGVPWSRTIDRELADKLLMTWDQVRELRRAGMDVQSHTRTHRVLQTIRPELLADELKGSRADLERELGEPIRAVSYPVGKAIALRPAIRTAVREAGYQIGFSNSTGINHLWGKFDRYDIHRLAVDIDLPAAYFRGILAIPYLAP
jgi:peptidoglycan/xylan/chitin deacetylase (PgdA/CDA1 family)